MNRRTFLKTAVGTCAAAPVTAVGYGFAEAVSPRVERLTFPLPNLPRSFSGLRVAFLTDLHHGPYTELEFLAGVVRTVQALQPDLVLLGGDYSLRQAKYIRPVFEVLAGLSAPFGVYGVLGNHDYWHGLDETRAGMRRAGVTELTNAGVWIRNGADRVRLAGVDDLWCGKPDLSTAVGDASPADAVLLVCHNPDFAETMRDNRVGLMVSGHTHGGQLILPGVRNPFIPSRYGEKYNHGVVEAPATTVYVSRGLGLTGLPVRYNCPPELTLLTLTTAG